MPDVYMNYGSMENMQKAFQKAQQQVQESMQEMEKIAKSLEGGALLGSAGDAFKDAIRSKLEKAMQTISEDMGQLAQDINGAVIATRDGVSTAQSRFK
jgi:uncharacterized protein YukE